MSIRGDSSRLHDHPHNWTSGAPKIAAAIALLVLAGAGLSLSLVRGAGSASAASAVAPIERRIDLNTATAAELESLPAIGPRRAEAIIADRAARGPFRSVDDLDRVHGIGPGTINRIRDYVLASPGADAPGR